MRPMKTVAKDANLVKLVEKSNSIFQSLRKRKLITEEELKKDFTYKYKKAINFGKMYLLPKIHKRLVNVSGVLLYQTALRLLRKLPNF